MACTPSVSTKIRQLLHPVGTVRSYVLEEALALPSDAGVMEIAVGTATERVVEIRHDVPGRNERGRVAYDVEDVLMQQIQGSLAVLCAEVEHYHDRDFEHTDDIDRAIVSRVAFDTEQLYKISPPFSQA